MFIILIESSIKVRVCWNHPFLCHWSLLHSVGLHIFCCTPWTSPLLFEVWFPYLSFLLLFDLWQWLPHPLGLMAVGPKDCVTSNGSFSFSSSCPKFSLWKDTSSMSVICSVFIFCFGPSKSIKDFCFLALALSLFPSSLDQSECTGEGCGASCLQYGQVGPKHSHAFLGVGLIISVLFMSILSVFVVLHLLVFMGLNLWFLWDHLVLILPRACFLEILGVLGSAENWTVLPLFHGLVFCFLSSLNAWFFCLNEGKGSHFYSME